MRSLVPLLLAATAALPAHAAEPAVCGGDPAFASFKGTWVLPGFLDLLRRTRSFSAAQKGVEDQHTAVDIRDRTVQFNAAWHEGNEIRECVRVQGDRILVSETPDGGPAQWWGPYVRTPAKSPEDDDAVYLRPFFSGCWRSDHAETWCLAPDGIRIDGRRIAAALQKDASERPEYGTAFQTTLTPHPFTVFMPVADGWDVFQDDWRNGDPPIDPKRDKPWRRLRSK
jgi:hypothetical protein